MYQLPSFAKNFHKTSRILFNNTGELFCDVTIIAFYKCSSGAETKAMLFYCKRELKIKLNRRVGTSKYRWWLSRPSLYRLTWLVVCVETSRWGLVGQYNSSRALGDAHRKVTADLPHCQLQSRSSDRHCLTVKDAPQLMTGQFVKCRGLHGRLTGREPSWQSLKSSQASFTRTLHGWIMESACDIFSV